MTRIPIRSALLVALLLALLAACSGPATDPEAEALAALRAGPEIILLPNGFMPEGVATGRGHELFAGSLADGSIVRIDLLRGEGDLVVPTQAGRIAVGLSYDGRSDLIWVAGGGSFAGEPAGYAYDAASGAPLASYDFGGGFVNDVVVTRRAAWFTDSFAPVLYKVPLGPAGHPLGGFEAVALGGEFVFVPGEFNTNGIDATPNGDTLVIVNSNLGTLYSVDAATGTAHLIDLGGASVPSGDGLVLDGLTLYVVQNVFNTIAAVRLSPDLASGEVVAEIVSPDFDVPTTAAGFGSSLFAVNARFGTPPTPDTEYDVVKVDKVPTQP